MDTHRPGLAPALGLRAGNDAASHSTQTARRFLMNAKTGILCGMVTFLVFGGASIASAQTEVFGSASVHYNNGTPEGGTFFRHVAVNAWLDENGVPHGTMTWEGDTDLVPDGGGRPLYVGGLSDPFLMEVVDLWFDGDTAYVFAIVVHAPNDVDIGGSTYFAFTDNSGTDDPDEINFAPIDAGNITVR
jgi:hypothetical protein